jgi:hypothetical protein
MQWPVRVTVCLNQLPTQRQRWGVGTSRNAIGGAGIVADDGRANRGRFKGDAFGDRRANR